MPNFCTAIAGLGGLFFVFVLVVVAVVDLLEADLARCSKFTATAASFMLFLSPLEATSK